MERNQPEAPLDPFFNPRGVAVIGASRDPHKLGYGVVRNLTDYHYRGPIYPINPIAREILGYTCYPSIADAPDPVDLAVIVVAAPAVAAMVDQCGRRGIRHVIVVSGGFSEIGPEGRAREEALVEVARQHGMRIIGPNCVGTIDSHTPLDATFLLGLPQSGNIGFVSQSGALCATVLVWAQETGMGFSRMASLGNQADVNETEILTAMAADPQTGVITVYIEGVDDGPAFMQAAEEAARHKPVVVLKVGRGTAGAKAAASHTGALAGSDEAYAAAFRRCGVLRANTMEELFDWGRALAWQPLPRGSRVGVLTNAGGLAVLAADAIDAVGLQLAPLTDETHAFLRPRLPAAASLANPVDLLGGSGAGAYAVALDALLADSTVDAAIVLQAPPQGWFLSTSLAEAIADLSTIHRKPVLASFVGLPASDPSLTTLRQRRIPHFRFPEQAVAALAAMVARRQWLDLPAEPPVKLSGVDHGAACAAFDRGDFASLLAAYGIALPPTRLAACADEAAALADEVGYPIALKLASPGITHKSDIGGVVLNLEDGEAVRAAFGRIVEAARAAYPEAVIEGVSVQKMLIGGQEVIVGMRRDPQFGPLVLVGSGGVEVELVRDVATGISPLTRAEAERMLDATRAGVRLKGWRNFPPADREAVLDAMLRLSQAACDFPAIAELEINPLYVLPQGEGAFAVDVRGR
jgi:acetyl coenzyme A synthetase (ADP forming)-like protein